MRAHALCLVLVGLGGGCASEPSPGVDGSVLPNEPAPGEDAASDAPASASSSRAVCDREEVVALEGGRTVRTKLPCRPYDPLRDAPDPPL